MVGLTHDLAGETMRLVPDEDGYWAARDRLWSVSPGPDSRNGGVPAAFEIINGQTRRHLYRRRKVPTSARPDRLWRPYVDALAGDYDTEPKSRRATNDRPCVAGVGQIPQNDH